MCSARSSPRAHLGTGWPRAAQGDRYALLCATIQTVQLIMLTIAVGVRGDEGEG